MSRTKLLTIRVSAEEARRFERVAARFGVPISAMVRMLIKKADDAARLKLTSAQQSEAKR